MALLGNKEYFKGIGEIQFEGKGSDNPLAFKYYNPDQVVDVHVVHVAAREEAAAVRLHGKGID